MTTKEQWADLRNIETKLERLEEMAREAQHSLVRAEAEAKAKAKAKAKARGSKPLSPELRMSLADLMK